MRRRSTTMRWFSRTRRSLPVPPLRVKISLRKSAIAVSSTPVPW